MKLSYEYAYYILARVIGLSTKPLFLYLLIDYDKKTEAENLALYFLVTTSVFILMNAPLHFNFYKNYFD